MPAGIPGGAASAAWPGGATPWSSRPFWPSLPPCLPSAKGAKTYNGGSLASYVYTTTYTVIQIDGSRVVIGINGVVTAAVNIKDLTLVG